MEHVHFEVNSSDSAYRSHYRSQIIQTLETALVGSTFFMSGIGLTTTGIKNHLTTHPDLS